MSDTFSFQDFIAVAQSYVAEKNQLLKTRHDVPDPWQMSMNQEAAEVKITGANGISIRCDMQIAGS